MTTDLTALFLLLAGIALVIGAVTGIANTTMMAVLERVGEMGLRRALGARPRHVAAQFLTESATLGTGGGCAGACLGVLVVVGVAVAHRWTPVLDQGDGRRRAVRGHAGRRARRRLLPPSGRPGSSRSARYGGDLFESRGDPDRVPARIPGPEGAEPTSTSGWPPAPTCYGGEMSHPDMPGSMLRRRSTLATAATAALAVPLLAPTRAGAATAAAPVKRIPAAAAPAHPAGSRSACCRCTLRDLSRPDPVVPGIPFRDFMVRHLGTRQHPGSGQPHADWLLPAAWTHVRGAQRVAARRARRTPYARSDRCPGAARGRAVPGGDLLARGREDHHRVFAAARRTRAPPTVRTGYGERVERRPVALPEHCAQAAGRTSRRAAARIRGRAGARMSHHEVAERDPGYHGVGAGQVAQEWRQRANREQAGWARAAEAAIRLTGAAAVAPHAQVEASNGTTSAAVAAVARNERRDGVLPGMSGWDMSPPCKSVRRASRS